jgi:NADPH-dependent ferric siderophore reductase
MSTAAVLARPFPLSTGVADVVARREVTPLMARFTLHDPGFATMGVEEPGEILTLGWCEPGEELVLPEVGWRFAGRAEQHWRNFTVRAFRPDAAEVDVDFFLHGDLGRASAWAARAQPGATVGYAGVRMHFRHDPAAEWTLLVADETGLPALLAIAESLPAGHPVIALAEVRDEDEHQPVQTDAALDLRWLHRGERAPATATVIGDAMAALELPDGPGQIWGGGESLAMRRVRDAARAAGAPRGTMHVMGYWKHRATPDDAEDDA